MLNVVLVKYIPLLLVIAFKVLKGARFYYLEIYFFSK